MDEIEKTDKDDIRETLGAGNGKAGKRRWRSGLSWLLVLALVIAAALLSGAKKTETIRYTTADAEKGPLTVTVSATGNLKPVNSIDIGTEVSGTVKAVEADYNDRIRAGQVLVRLDTEKLDAEILKSRAALASAQAKLLQTQTTTSESDKSLKRLQHAAGLSGGKAVSKQDLDAAEATHARALADEAAARAQVAEAEANLSADRTNLSKATIRAPISGIILTRSIEPGQTVAASLSSPVLLTMAEKLSQMELHVSVDEADVGKIRKGQSARFTVDAWPDRTFPGRITAVHLASTTTNGVVTYETVIAVSNPDLALRPGMTATADITVQQVGNALLVPNAALRFTPPEPGTAAKKSEGLLGSLMPHPPASSPRKTVEANNVDHNRKVWLLKDGVPTPIAVTTGLTDGKMTEILSGEVKPGMALIVDSASVAK
ncbi:MAG TPA: efflux RND transporter periplasmic adaptor subunit [Candidatus Deferrimicrobiaceae bacterium]|jgi:HlyD family secretion protein